MLRYYQVLPTTNTNGLVNCCTVKLHCPVHTYRLILNLYIVRTCFSFHYSGKDINLFFLQIGKQFHVCVLQSYLHVKYCKDFAFYPADVYPSCDRGDLSAIRLRNSQTDPPSNSTNVTKNPGFLHTDCSHVYFNPNGKIMKPARLIYIELQTT